MRLRLSILTACALSVAAVLAGPAPAIVDGAPAGEAHPYVGTVLVLGGMRCSGSLVAPDRVVTAAHCFIGPSGEASLRHVLVTFQNPALHPSMPGARYVPGVATLHPGFDAHTETGYTDDVAVVKLVAPYPGAHELARIPRMQASRPMLGKGESAEAVGYGLTAFPPGPTSNAAPPWARHAKTVSLVRGPDQPNHLRIERSACFGDSGGGILAGDELLAVISISLAPGCAGEALGYRLDTVSAQKFLADNGVQTKFSR